MQIDVSAVSERLTAAKKLMDTDADLSGVYIFYSFDLVNSTSFKAKFLDDWPPVVEYFYLIVKEQLRFLHEDIKVWKHIGDEVLFYKRVTDLSELYSAPQFALNVIRAVNRELNKRFPITKKNLDCKSTIWLAQIEDKTKQENISGFSKNIVFLVDGVRGEGAKDFLGPDIDRGFRLSTYAHKQKVVVSPELVHIVSLRRDIESRIEKEQRYKIDKDLRIVNYQKLKGIWNDRLYPIIYFYDDWNKIDETFDYDDIINKSPLLTDMLSDKSNSELKIQYINRIFEDLGKDEEILKFIDIIEGSRPLNDENTITPIVPVQRISEVHCVAVCFNNNGHILLGKRPQTKNTAAGKWEFGCGQLNVFKDFETALVGSYQKDFGIKIDFGNELKPVRTFDIPHPLRLRKISGIIFIARTNDEDIKNNGHDQVRWFNPENLANIERSEYVDDFEKSVKAACEAAKIHFPELNQKILL
ncbi:NUDIX domain-containing protein [Bacillus cereus]|uniref:NUDIX domain-containing protein n=1 Tax=Bacillus cereus TaxID=1396 RepID=UPI0025A11250|nr:NUDIX domain-containing protein [Bacillus cereus]MDM5235323.1 NUDIX domain-containing protein [Bacillus cereus]